MPGGAPPQLLESLVTTAAITVVFVPERIFFVVVLMIFLGRIEFTCLNDLGHYRFPERLVFLKSFFLLQGTALLLFAGIEDGASVLIAAITELAIFDSRVDVAPEDVQQLVVTDFGRVEDDLDHFGVSRTTGGNLLVSGILLASARISRGDGDHSRQFVEGRLHARETTAGKGGFFGGCCRTSDLNQMQGEEQKRDDHHIAYHSVHGGDLVCLRI